MHIAELQQQHGYNPLSLIEGGLSVVHEKVMALVTEQVGNITNPQFNHGVRSYMNLQVAHGVVL